MPELPVFRRKPVASGHTMVSIRPALENSHIPVMIECLDRDVDVFDWIATYRDEVEERLSRAGSVLLRGFPLQLPSDFERVLESLSPNLISDYGDLPREQEGGRLYGSTVYPSEETILYHNESSHQHRWPMRISFCCMRAAASGGQTPLVDCREVLRRLPAEVAECFQRQDLLYVRNFVSGLDVSWEEFFGTNDLSKVEEICADTQTECAWQDGHLRTARRSPAIARHPWNGELVFFNQILLHHASMLSNDVRHSLVALFGESGLPRNVFYGNGEPIADKIVQQIRAVYDELAVDFKWQEKDVVILDNMSIAHGRRPFSGRRKILVAMAEVMDLSSLPRPDQANPTGVAEGHHA